MILENPGSASVIALSVISLVFYLGALMDNIRHMRLSMVTKKDLEIALHEFRDQLDEIFMSRKECDILEGKSRNRK